MSSIDIAYDQPWFDPVRLLRRREETVLRRYFETLEAIVSELLTEDLGGSETALTTTLVHSLRGVDSIAKRTLNDQLLGSQLSVEISAKELRGRPAVSGELLDFVIEVEISTGDATLLRRVLLVEGKRLYPDGDTFSEESQFKELNRPERPPGGERRVRSAVQAKTMIETHCRAGAFFLYCPRQVGGRRVGIRILFPETVCMLPRQPTLRQVLADTLRFPDFMVGHVFTSRRGIELESKSAQEIRAVMKDETGGTMALRHHLRLSIRLPRRV